MKQLTFSLHLSFLLVILQFVTPSVSLNVPRLSPTGRSFIHGNYLGQRRPSEASSAACDGNDLETFYYNQTLDHFNFRYDSFSTFPQRYMINSKHWGGANISAPILAYLGAEESVCDDIPVIGFMPENAIHFQALVIYIEHRYYGESMPFGSSDVAFKNASTLGYFNAAQAMADYAEILIHVKKQRHAEYSPVIVIGGSYGGMLASWFRLKYPHVALGALASSAPILYFDDTVPTETGFYSIVTKDFRDVSETCYQTIKQSWSKIDNVSSTHEGLSSLSQKFQTCRPLTQSYELKNYLIQMYYTAAQNDHAPRYPVTLICGGIDGASSTDDILTKIFAGVVAYYGNRTCYVNQPALTETHGGWAWQICADMVMPMSRDNNTMFQPYKFDLHQHIDQCNATYGVPPRPNWATTYFGGHDIKLSLSRFASNIIFSNGLRDPWSIAGVLEDISDSVVAVHTKNGSHCLDIYFSNHTTDPDWLVNQRKREVRIIEGWIATYYGDLPSQIGDKLIQNISLPV